MPGWRSATGDEGERTQNPEMVRKSQQHLTADDVGM